MYGCSFADRSPDVSPAPNMHIPIFLVFYSTTFTILLLALIALLLVSPADAIYQSLRNNQPANVIIVAGAYLLTLLVSGFFYATRLYATRTHLAALPRSARIPETLAGGAVRRIVRSGLARAAAIAYAAHPRDLVAERDFNGGQSPPPPPELSVPGSDPTPEVIRSMLKPAFGVIQHPGWTAPSTADLPRVHFPPVIEELPHLLEAKAVSLAPSEASASVTKWRAADAEDENTALVAASLPDPFAVGILQRPNSMDVRAYVNYLDSLGTITDAEAASSFVKQYEYARFSGGVLDEVEFRRLMRTFAWLLRSLTTPDADLLRDLAESDRTSIGSTSRIAQSVAPSVHSQPSMQGMRPERPSIPKRGNTTGSASAILDRLAAQDSDTRSKRSGPLRQPTSHPFVGSLPIGSAFPASPSGSTPLPNTPTPHHTPFFTPYRTSISSNDGDRSADTSDAELSDSSASKGLGSVLAAGIGSSLQRQRSRRQTLTRRSTHSSSVRRRTIRGLGLEMTRARESTPSRSTEEDAYLSFGSRDSDEDEEVEDGGSVIRRIVTAQEVSHNSPSNSDAGSVVVRPEDHGVGGLLPIPVAVEDMDGHGASDVAEMRMVDRS